MKRLDLQNCREIALIGAGGKSTLATALCLALPGDNAFTTTTHAFFPSALVPVQSPDAAALAALFDGQGAACAKPPAVAVLGDTVALVNGRVKAGPPTDAVFSFLRARCDHILIEADGAAGRLLKLHRAHEPVVPESADAVLFVCSLGALGRPLSQICHRADDVEARLGKRADSLCTETDIVCCARLGTAPFPHAAVVLNAAGDMRAAARIRAALAAEGRDCLIIPDFSGLGERALLARAAEALLGVR